MARSSGARYQQPTTLVGSAIRMSGRIDGPMTLPPAAAWQSVLWNYFDTLGEMSFAASWIGNALSRIRLVAAEVDGYGMEPVPIDDPNDWSVQALQAFAGGASGQSETLRTQGIHMSVPGDSWLVGEPDDDGDLANAEWFVVTRDEIEKRGETFRIQVDEGKWRELHPDSIITKVMRGHPRRRWEPWSPNRAALPILAEIKLLSQHIYSSAQSRLAGAGVFIIPSEWSLPGSAQQAGQPQPLVEIIGESMMTALQNPEHPAARVPIVLQVKGEYADKAQLITFDTPFEDRILDLRESAIRRYGASIDLPAEVLLGIADLQHWNAWAVSEQAQTLHIEPLMALLCHAYTEGFLHPVGDALGEDTSRRIIWYDPSELTVRPDRSDNAIALYDRILVGGAAARREAGLNETDAPTEDEVRRQVILNTIKSAPTLAPLLLPAIGIDVSLPAETTQALADASPDVPVTDAEPAAAPVDQATPPAGPPVQASTRDVLAAACDGIVWRALERAGSRLRSVGGESVRAGLNGTPVVETHTSLGGVASGHVDDLLRDAWSRVPSVAGRYGVNPEALAAVLHAHTSALLMSGAAYDPDALAEVVSCLVDQ